jgi:hypothetical protein
VVNQWEAAEKQAEKGQSHKESQNICIAKHVHAILINLIIRDRIRVVIVSSKVGATEANGAHDSYQYIGAAHQYIAKKHISLIVCLVLIVFNYWKTHGMQEIANAQ